MTLLPGTPQRSNPHPPVKLYHTHCLGASYRRSRKTRAHPVLGFFAGSGLFGSCRKSTKGERTGVTEADILWEELDEGVRKIVPAETQLVVETEECGEVIRRVEESGEGIHTTADPKVTGGGEVAVSLCSVAGCPTRRRKGLSGGVSLFLQQLRAELSGGNSGRTHKCSLPLMMSGRGCHVINLRI